MNHSPLNHHHWRVVVLAACGLLGLTLLLSRTGIPPASYSGARRTKGRCQIPSGTR